MNIRIVTLFCLLTSFNCVVHAKDFINLDFDLGGYPSPPFSTFQPADFVLPGWTARMGDHVQSDIIWNNAFDANGLVGVRSVGGSWGALPEGRYSVRLTAGPEYPSESPTVPASISQMGTIPTEARSLVFRSNLGAAAPTEIRFDGQLLTPYLLGDPQNQPNWGGEWAVDIGNVAGKEGELSFTTHPYPNERFGGFDIDSLQFSSRVVPEPSTWILLGGGSFAMIYGARRRDFNS